MHYRNGREAKNGDIIVKLANCKIISLGVLHSVVPGSGYIEPIQSANDYACMVDCLNVEDIAEVLAQHKLDKRP